MTVASAHGLTTQRAADWREQASCRNEDPNLFFPKGDSGPWLIAIEQAKAICRACPVLETCGQWAAAQRIEYGIFGALTEQERASIRRSTRRRRLNPEAAAKKTEEARQPVKPRTLQSIYDDNTVRLHGGHLGWTGTKKIHYRGQLFTPKQLAFVLDRLHMPDGLVRAECGISDCILPEHLADVRERTRCGTRPGYQQHRARGEEACGPCKRANADADNRLRWTGTTKAAV
jgi:hypothetical protein